MVFEDGLRKIKIEDNVLARIRLFCQIKNNMPESGGILAGRENISNDNMIIENITEPMASDYQSRCRFTRKDPGHITFFQKLYRENNGTVRYIGEWHTHPEDVPHYSIIDLKNWKKIYRNAIEKQSQYHLIAGRKAIVIWKYSALNFLPVEVLSVNWEDYSGTVIEDV